MTISRALEMALLHRASSRPQVSISRKAGEWDFEVRCVHDDPEEAEAQAMRIVARLTEQYPQPLSETVYDAELTRNAKGETQIKLSAKTGEPEDVAAVYERLRGRYPLADGTATHDAPKQRASTK